MKRILAAVLLIITLFTTESCTKSDDNKKHCWKCTMMQNQVKKEERVCDKTQSEISNYISLTGLGSQTPSKTNCVAE
jgi:hypothetical protein